MPRAAVEMPKVKVCDVMQCAYNRDKACHALAITVGDGDIPRCDTFAQMPQKGGIADAIAGVGACKVSACEYNQGLECHASGIRVGLVHDQAECLTFEAR